MLRPCWAPPLVLQRRRHTRSYRIEVAPRSYREAKTASERPLGVISGGVSEVSRRVSGDFRPDLSGFRGREGCWGSVRGRILSFHMRRLIFGPFGYIKARRGQEAIRNVLDLPSMRLFEAETRLKID